MSQNRQKYAKYFQRLSALTELEVKSAEEDGIGVGYARVSNLWPNLTGKMKSHAI
jgi:hypothetical protein